MNSAVAMAGEGVTKVKVRYEEGERPILDKDYCFKDKIMKSNPEGAQLKTTKMCSSDPVVKELSGNTIKLVGLSTAQEFRRKASGGVKRIRIGEVLHYFTESGSGSAQTKAGRRKANNQQEILSSRCEVMLEKICIPIVEGQLTECRVKPLIKEGFHGKTVQALVLQPKTIKQVLHNGAVHSKYNEGHEDDLFGQSKGQAGYGPLKKQNVQWQGKLISKDDSSGDESILGGKSDPGRGRSPSRWSMACQPLSPTPAGKCGTPERSRWRNLSPVVLHTERQRAAFQVRKLKERSKTEVNPRRVGISDQRSRLMIKRRNLWYDEGTIKGEKVERKSGVRDQEKIFEEMVAQVRGSAGGRREDTPDSDCEKYFSDD